ncbi:MAG: GHKL domain-containing protein [Balneolia bacterium]|nr:GHKL domain-containing protein [Balneolia bacterium]
MKIYIHLIKTLLLTIVMILIQDASLAQQNAHVLGPSENQIDSLQHRFSIETSDRLRMGMARELGLFYTEADQDTAIYFADIQLQLARSLGERLWEGDAHRRLGYLTYTQGRYSESFSHISEALILFTDASTERQVWEPGRLSLAGTPEVARLSGLALTYHIRALLYLQISNTAEQRAHNRKTIEISEKIGDNAIASLAYSNLGQSYIEEYPDSARIYIGIALEKGESVGYRRYRGNDLRYMGMAHEALNDFDSAEKYYLEAIAENREANNIWYLGRAYYRLARINQLTGDTTRALENARNSYEVAGSTNNLADISEAALLLSTLYEQLNDTDNAYYYLKQSQTALENLQKEEQVRRTSDLQFAEQLRLRDVEEVQARSQAQLRMNALMGVLFTITVVAFLMYRNYRQQQAANKKLENTLDNLKAAQDQLIQQEKLASLGQLTAGIAHEIKNPLNFVNNFSEVSDEMIDEALEELGKTNQDEHTAETATILADIKANLAKIHQHGTRADSIVKSMLEHSRGGSGKKEPSDFNGILKEFTNLSFHGMRASKKPINVDLQYHLDESINDVQLIAEDFSRVIINLCNNAFDAMREKQGSEHNSAGYEPKLTIRTHQTDKTVVVEFEDNGPGIPQEMKNKILEPFYTTKKGTEGTGLGLSITNDIVKAHGGDIRIETEAGLFTRFIITLPSNTTS